MKEKQQYYTEVRVFKYYCSHRMAPVSAVMLLIIIIIDALTHKQQLNVKVGGSGHGGILSATLEILVGIYLLSLLAILLHLCNYTEMYFCIQHRFKCTNPHLIMTNLCATTISN